MSFYRRRWIVFIVVSLLLIEFFPCFLKRRGESEGRRGREGERERDSECCDRFWCHCLSRGSHTIVISITFAHPVSHRVTKSVSGRGKNASDLHVHVHRESLRGNSERESTEGETREGKQLDARGEFESERGKRIRADDGVRRVRRERESKQERQRHERRRRMEEEGR